MWACRFNAPLRCHDETCNRPRVRSANRFRARDLSTSSGARPEPLATTREIKLHPPEPKASMRVALSA
jgi:hypothetical protein